MRGRRLVLSLVGQSRPCLLPSSTSTQRLQARSFSIIRQQPGPAILSTNSSWLRLDRNITHVVDRTPDITEEECRCVIKEPTEEQLDQMETRFKTSLPQPLVLVFGWAGASEKNLDKYGLVYRSAGCTTVQYILPTRSTICYCTDPVYRIYLGI